MTPIIAKPAAIFLIGQTSAQWGISARAARTSQNTTPAASTMCSPEIETTW